jgi:hypothetical protein
MGKSKKKLFVFTLGSIVAIIFPLTIVVFKDLIVEEWYIHLLNSRDFDTCINAVDVLGNIKSKRSIPFIIQRLKNLFDKQDYSLLKNFNTEQLISKCGESLFNMGKPSIIYLFYKLNDDNIAFSFYCSEILKKIYFGNDYKPKIPTRIMDVILESKDSSLCFLDESDKEIEFVTKLNEDSRREIVIKILEMYRDNENEDFSIREAASKALKNI